jgi:D-cysteine desulfhydrase
VHGLFVLVEHATTPLGGRLHRLTALDPASREAFLRSLAARGGLLAQAYRGLRDLCLLGHYQDPSAWKELGYGGPWGRSPTDATAVAYEELRAPAAAMPRAAQKP